MCKALDCKLKCIIISNYFSCERNQFVLSVVGSVYLWTWYKIQFAVCILKTSWRAMLWSVHALCINIIILIETVVAILCWS